MTFDVYHQGRLLGNTLTLSDASNRAMVSVAPLLPLPRGSAMREQPFMVFRPWPVQWDAQGFKPERTEGLVDALKGYVVFDEKLLNYNVIVFEYRP